MPIAFDERWCPHCHRFTGHQREGVNHPLHLIFTLLTCGLWAVGWITLTALSRFRPAYCTCCGKRHGRFESPLKANFNAQSD